MAEEGKSGARVLVFREEGDFRPDLRRRLEKAGYRITTVRHRHGRGGLGDDQVEALVMDLHVLGQTGFVLISRSGRPGPALSATLAPRPEAGVAIQAPIVLAESSLDFIDIAEEGVSLPDLERVLLRKALVRTGGNQTQAAHILGITRQTMIYRMRKYGFDREGYE